MDSEARPQRTARKSFRGQGNAINTAPDINESASKATSSIVSNTVRKNARKSMGTLNAAVNNTNQTTQSVSTTTRSSSRISQHTTLSLSQPSCSRDSDSSDSDILPTSTQKISKSKAPSVSKPKKAHVVESSSPSSTSEADKSLKKIADSSNVVGKPTGNVNNLASQCVFYILVANRSKKAIKKNDIIKSVFEGRNHTLFPEVLKRAASMLQKTFGFELMELKNSKNEYLLVNNLCHQYDIQEFTEYSQNETHMQGFIFYILALIFMNENSIKEEELWKALDPLGVEINSKKPHPIFGDVQKLVTNTLVKQMYLERRQLSKDPPEFELTWGERAHKEVLKEDLLDFACEIMPDTKPEEWILQYKDARGRAPEDDVEME